MAKDERRKTEYVVLRKWQGMQGGDDRVELWEAIGTTEARSKREAIHVLAQEDGQPYSGRFKAVPASSWKGGLNREVKMEPHVDESEITDESPPAVRAAAPSE